jgi:hypothetical protein
MNRSALRLPTFVLLLSLAGVIATEITRAETSKTIENSSLWSSSNQSLLRSRDPTLL